MEFVGADVNVANQEAPTRSVRDVDRYGAGASAGGVGDGVAGGVAGGVTGGVTGGVAGVAGRFVLRRTRFTMFQLDSNT
jgi:hypothetical protein